MRIRPGLEGMCYVGACPSGQGGTIRIALGDMSAAQLRGWLRIDYGTASRYIEGAVRIPEKKETIDNQPGAPLPKKPQYEAETDREKEHPANSTGQTD